MVLFAREAPERRRDAGPVDALQLLSARISHKTRQDRPGSDRRRTAVDLKAAGLYLATLSPPEIEMEEIPADRILNAHVEVGVLQGASAPWIAKVIFERALRPG